MGPPELEDEIPAQAREQLWGVTVAHGRASLGLAPEGGATIELDLEHPDLTAVATEDLPLALVTCASAGVVVPR